MSKAAYQELTAAVKDLSTQRQTVLSTESLRRNTLVEAVAKVCEDWRKRVGAQCGTMFREVKTEIDTAKSRWDEAEREIDAELTSLETLGEQISKLTTDVCSNSQSFALSFINRLETLSASQREIRTSLERVERDCYAVVLKSAELLGPNTLQFTVENRKPLRLSDLSVMLGFDKEDSDLFVSTIELEGFEAHTFSFELSPDFDLQQHYLVYVNSSRGPISNSLPLLP